jgi:hypothetical protein
MININITYIRPKTNPIQSGLNTHHQDQAITFVNFNAINKIVNTPTNLCFS